MTHSSLAAKMAEVTRLTRAGRLAEAMALLHGPRSNVATLDGLAERLTGKPGTFNSRAIDVHLQKDIAALLERFKKIGSALAPAARSPQPETRARVPAARVSAQALFEERTFLNDAGTRTYKLYVPGGHHQGELLPLVVMLHGCAQSADDFALGTRMNELAEEQKFLVAYPNQSPAANGSKCWNWFKPEDQARGRGEPSLIAGIARDILRDAGGDPTRVYVAGLSAGGALATVLASQYPDLFAGVGVHSGLPCGVASDLTTAFAAMRQGSSSVRTHAQGPIPTIVFHGDRDTTVSPINGDHIIMQSKAATRLESTTYQGVSDGGLAYTRTVQADGAGQALLEQWVLHGAGHAWSGGSSAGSFTAPHGPDASREMIRFFLAHRRR